MSLVDELTKNLNITELRKHRIGDFAVFDFVVAYLGAWILAPYLKDWISRRRLIYLVLPVGIAVHLLLGVETKLTKMFMDPNNHYILKIIVAIMTIVGLDL